MNLVLVILVAALIIAALAALWFELRDRRSTNLRQRFGPEHDRGFVQRFEIRRLSTNDRDRYLKSWRAAQQRFYDHPAGAIQDADRLAEEVMRERGYPLSDLDDQRSTGLFPGHPQAVENYHAAHNIAVRYGRGQADTEDLQRAMFHYQALFEELLEPRTGVLRH